MTASRRGEAPEESGQIDGPGPESPLRPARLIDLGRRPRGRIYATIRWGGLLVFVALVVSLVVSLVWQAAPAFRHSGFNFIFNGTWNPDTEQFGAGVFIIDTLITTGIGLL